MAAAGRRRGRRDNGLDAVDWRAIDDLDPRLVEEVLDLLADRGIAAYVQPAMDIDPITRSATVPSRPADRLYVDRQQVQAARECLRRHSGARADPLAGRPAGEQPAESPAAESLADKPPAADPAHPDGQPHSELDATFAGIVAGFHRPVDPTAAPWPASENVPGTASASSAAQAEPTPGGPTTDPTTDEPTAEATPPASAPPTGPIDARDITEPSLLDALDTFGRDLPDDQEPPEKFVPPPPPPLPRLSRQAVLGSLAIVVGLILLIGRPSGLPMERGTTMLVGFAMILGGAVALILRLRTDHDPDDSHPDDGARV